MDFYKILNVDKNSTDEEIKKSYRALSYKYHPDRNNNEDAGKKMKEINEAYETLKDPRKKQLYDLGSSSENPFDEIIGNIFKGHKFKRTSNPIEDLFNEHVTFTGFMNMNRDEIQPDLEKKIEITFRDSFLGVNIPLTIKRKIIKGNNIIYEQEKIYIKINPGTDDGEIINIQNKGNVCNNMVSDLRIHIKVIPHHLFQREGLNLIYYNKITFKESLCGFETNIQTLTDQTLKIQSSRGNIIQNHDEKIIPHKGFTRNDHTGNLIIKFIVEKPAKLTEEQLSLLHNIF